MRHGPFPELIDEALRRFLAEDVGAGDVTTRALVSPGQQGCARFLAKSEGIVCGLDVAERIFELIDPHCRLSRRVDEGARFGAGTELMLIEGPFAALLMGERTALNLLQRMSGIATTTAQFVAEVAGTRAQIFDTRKTAPGLRWFDKRAVSAGGGHNHRFGLFDQVLIKENHLAALTGRPGMRAIEEAIERARAAVHQGVVVEIEVLDAKEAARAAGAGADVILLDNFTLDELREAVASVRGRRLKSAAILEASGGITLEVVKDVAHTGVDRVSVGALTHSVRAKDISLELSH